MKYTGLCVLLLLAGCARTASTPLPARPVLAGWDSLTTTDVAPGVTQIAGLRTDVPWAVQILRIDRAVCRPRLTARKAGPTLAERAPTTALAAGDLAAINADFFLLPSGVPVGAHVTAGRVLAGPGLRPAFLAGQGFAAGVARLSAYAFTHADTALIDRLNRPLTGHPHHGPAQSLALYTTWYGDTVGASADAPAATIRLIDDDGPAGSGLITALTDNGVVEIGPDHVVLRADTGAVGWIRRRAIGDTVRWNVVVEHGETRAAEAVGGFPLLVAGGRSVVRDQPGINEGFASRHPRTAIGWNAAALFMVVVDGRQPGWSVGMTLEELAGLFVALGVTDAINLDGGGSTAMAVHGRLVNRPSDREGERSVANALALTACG